MLPEILAVGGTAFAALGLHPFTTYPLTLAALSRMRKVKDIAVPAKAPSAALLVCAYNEERVIAAKAENMLAMRRVVPDLDLLIYVDGSSDRTAEILDPYRKHGIKVVVSHKRLGKTHGMNTLVDLTNAEILVFSDANVTFNADAVPNLVVRFADPDVGCVCGHLRYTTTEATATASTGSLYWRLEERIKHLESETGSVMGADGSIFAVRRHLHRSPPPDLIDDMYVSLSILIEGYRVVRAGDAIAYEEITTKAGDEFRRKIRIACQAFNVHRTIAPRLRGLSLLDRYKYVSHKLLRWFCAYSFVTSAVLFAAAATTAGLEILVFLAGVAPLLAAFHAQRRPEGVSAKLFDAAGAFLATGVGVFRSARGDRFQTWTPPASARSTSTDHAA